MYNYLFKNTIGTKIYLTFELQSNYKLVCCLITVKQEECAIAILFAKQKGLQMRCRPFYLASLKIFFFNTLLC